MRISGGKIHFLIKGGCSNQIIQEDLVMKYRVIFLLFTLFIIPAIVYAHCDTFEGPVVKDARIALEKGQVTPVLKWIKPEFEKQITELFKNTLLVRVTSSEARELADMYFFETLVRLHRAGEGETYTGLKSTPVEPIVAKSDQVLLSGRVDELINELTNESTNRINELYRDVINKKNNAESSIESGREYVEAYVKFTHFVENLHKALAGPESVHHQQGH
jgi:hypothetical protein